MNNKISKENYKKVKLGDLIVDFTRGIPYRNINDTNRQEDSLVYINSSNIQNGSITTELKKYLAKASIPKKMIVTKDDILIATIAGNFDSLGKTALVPKKYEGELVIGNSLASLKIDTKKAEPSFIAHILNSTIFKEYISNVSSSSTTKNLNKKFLEEFSFPLPSLKEQKEAAKMLNKIEQAKFNIEKKVETLENIRQGILIKLLQPA